MAETSGLAHADDCPDDISDARNEPNGGAGCVLDGGYSLTITETGSITTTADYELGVSATGGHNIVSNKGGVLTCAPWLPHS